MKKLYEKIHIDYMKEFLKKHLSSILKDNLDLQALKHVQYLDKQQLYLLVDFFNIDKMTEERLSKQLSKIGFFSKINIYEKRAIYSDYSRLSLSRTINYNECLIDYSILQKNTTSNIKITLLKALKNYNKKIKNRISTPRATYIKRVDPENIRDRKKPLFFDPLNQHTFSNFFTNECLRSVKQEEDTSPVLPPKTEAIININDYNNFPTTRNVTIYDRIDNPNIILRRKKSLYLEHSKPIEYHNNNNTNLNDVSLFLEEIPEYTFPIEIYKNFDLTAFVNKILFENNGIPVPTVCKYPNFSEFRQHMKGNLCFIRYYLKKRIKTLLLTQDKYLSVTDAKFLSRELEKVIPLAGMEYFYSEYLSSTDFKHANVDIKADVGNNKDKKNEIIIGKEPKKNENINSRGAKSIAHTKIDKINEDNIEENL